MLLNERMIENRVARLKAVGPNQEGMLSQGEKAGLLVAQQEVTRVASAKEDTARVACLHGGKNSRIAGGEYRHRRSVAEREDA